MLRHRNRGKTGITRDMADFNEVINLLVEGTGTVRQKRPQVKTEFHVAPCVREVDREAIGVPATPSNRKAR